MPKNNFNSAINLRILFYFYANSELRIKKQLKIGKHPLCHWRKHAFYGVASSVIYILQNGKRRICKNIYSKYLYYHFIPEAIAGRCSA